MRKRSGRIYGTSIFATHGALDREVPLNSAIALQTSGQDSPENGLLQAWELFEHVRWLSDLVVVSGCETALGKDFDGEGLLGLTRAIQYAGAKSVLASLWNVDDRRTAMFMEKFYSRLHAGDSKDQALREAQIEFIKSPTNRRPAHWSGFVLRR
jgi:CHAT domain-containing protein